MSITRIAGLVAGLGENGGTSAALNTTGADAIVLAVAYDSSVNPTASAISDAKSNTYTSLTQREQGGPAVQLYYCLAPVVGSGHTFTVTLNASYAAIGVLALAGVKASSAFDAENGGVTTGSQTTVQPGSISPAEDNEILVSGLAIGGVRGISIDGGYTIEGTADLVSGSSFGVSLAYLIQTNKGASNPTWTADLLIMMAAGSACFKAAASSPTIPTHLLMTRSIGLSLF